jgi:Protein of unknown function (DUF732)
MKRVAMVAASAATTLLLTGGVAHAYGHYYGSQGDGDGLAYLNELRDAGVPGGDAGGAAAMAQQICWARAQGTREVDLVGVAQADGWTMHQGAVKVVHAEYHFCPGAMTWWPGSHHDDDQPGWHSPPGSGANF